MLPRNDPRQRPELAGVHQQGDLRPLAAEVRNDRRGLRGRGEHSVRSRARHLGRRLRRGPAVVGDHQRPGHRLPPGRTGRAHGPQPGRFQRQLRERKEERLPLCQPVRRRRRLRGLCQRLSETFRFGIMRRVAVSAFRDFPLLGNGHLGWSEGK